MLAEWRRRDGLLERIKHTLLNCHPIVTTTLRSPMNRKHRLRIERLETRLTPALATWDGGGADNHWTTAANWAGDVAPNPGDDLSFPFGAAQPITVNDFAAGTAFNSISTNATNYQFSGNAIA